MTTNSGKINPERPFIVRFAIPTGDRLTRYWFRMEEFATRDEAIAVLSQPFPAGVSMAHVVDFSTGRSDYIAERTRCKKLRLMRSSAA